jgi:hypothetical protein
MRRGNCCSLDAKQLCVINAETHIKIEVTINTVYATLFMYYPLLKDVISNATCFGSVEPSSGNMHVILQKLLYL